MRVHDPNRRNLLEGKVALVTGGGGSLGLAIARLFLKEGARVVLADRNAEGLAAAVSRLDDVQVTTVIGDGAREEDVAAAVERVVQRHGQLDVLVAVAGTSTPVAPVAEHAQVGLMRAVAQEVAGRGIRVNTVHPGPFANGSQPADPRIPLGRPPQPDDVARSVLYLASPMGSFTTASTLVVDGGMSA